MLTSTHSPAKSENVERLGLRYEASEGRSLWESTSRNAEFALDGLEYIMQGARGCAFFAASSS